MIIQFAASDIVGGWPRNFSSQNLVNLPGHSIIAFAYLYGEN
jgi:hypothetical protein